ncbi:monooxygenase [Paraliomyxa miuraensis]|uniref:monooxygenase n=1 Tax=Paraliomyxa miuraensis TaxID=376150 RepID=UPI0022548309|nr:hypothetical protein [Paraliomyxa miuraensis]MCX4240462.1 hypothetical protein [Paraliomyxa miuraensis]
MKARGLAWLVVGMVTSACGGDDAPADGSGPGTSEGTAPTTTPETASGEGTADGTDDTADATADDTSSENVRPNWHEDIAPLVAEHCSTCHTTGGIGPYPMEDYEQTRPLAPIMALQAQARIMPPWHAVETDECQPPAAFKHDARITEEQIQLLQDWSALGAPEGDPALAAPIPPPPSLDLANPTTTIGMGSSVEIEAQGSTLDFFHCLSFDPGHTQEVYLDGMQVIPGNAAIAHHVVIYVDLDGTSASWPGGISTNCGGGAGVSNVQMVGAWTPGNLPTETPEGVGIRLPVGARIVFNYHYHAAVTGPQTDDSSALALRWSTTPPTYIADFQLIGAPGFGSSTTSPFLIPAGATGHEEIIEYAVPNIGNVDVRVFSILNHMHKVGVDMKTSVLRGGQDLCLVQTPNWDFNWQRGYEYDVPIDQAFQVQSGDVVRVRCTYDNTLDNPAVVEALEEVGLDEPQNVTLGEATLDEMCVAGVGVAVRVGL